MKKLLIPAITALTLIGCGSDDDTNDVVETSDTVSLETCQDVSLSELRINSAPSVNLNTELTFTQALAVYKAPVVNGQEITAELTVPDDKDYNMALFDNEGTKLGCSDTTGFGENETIVYTVDGIDMLWVKVWTAASPTSSAFFLTLDTPIAVALTEEEPNDTLGTAQVVSESFSAITGSVNDGNADVDDYFQYTVAEGDIVTITGTVDSSSAEDFNYLTIRDQDGEEIYVDENGERVEGTDEFDNPLGEVLTHEFNATAGYSVEYTYVVPASQTKMYAWMNTLFGSASYSITVQIETP